MQQFLKIIECLKKDEFYTVMIEDVETNQQITEVWNKKPVINLNGEILTANHGSVETFFNQLLEKGHEKIRIYFRRKSGSTCKTVGEPKVFSLIPESEKPLTGPDKNKKVSKKPKGLSAPEQFKAFRYDELLNELAEVKRKKSKYKKEFERLREEALQNKYSTEKHAKNNEMLMGAMPFLAPIIQRFIPGGADVGAMAAEGLGNPEISQVKIAAMQRINLLSDDLAYFVGLIADNITNDSIQMDVIELTKKHNLDTE